MSGDVDATARTVVVGGASAALGDWAGAIPQLLGAARTPDYVVMDYMAELTSTFLARAWRKNPHGGFAKHFTDTIWRDNAPLLAATGTKLVTNAGGLNPRGCAARMREVASDLGLHHVIAVVDGDDLLGEFPRFAAEGSDARFGPVVAPMSDDVLSANVYFGAGPIVAALAAGADVVITGRTVDSALTLGPLIHEFGWRCDDLDQLAAGSLAGHILECGAQATGGLFTDWTEVPDWAHIGYPIAECEASGAFVVTKPEGTGGLCSTATVGEQILYEIGDPAAYLLPDVVCDFRDVSLTQVGRDRVQVTGARGRGPTGAQKVCVTYLDGWHTLAFLPVVGMDAAAKAAHQADALLRRFTETLHARGFPEPRATRVDLLGAEASYGRRARELGGREIICKIGIEHDDPAALDLFLSELAAHTVSMAVGSTGWFGNAPSRAPSVRVASYLVGADRVRPRITVEDRVLPAPSTPGPPEPAVPHLTRIPAPTDPPASDPDPATAEPTTPVALVRLAYGRSGDKGNHFNVGIIARRPEYLPWIAAALTESAVAEFFADDFDDPAVKTVRRYELPGMRALNFVCHNALDGAQIASLRTDVLAKGKAQQLLEYPIPVPAHIVDQLEEAT